MRRMRYHIICLTFLAALSCHTMATAQAHDKGNIPPPKTKGFLVPATVFQGDTIATFNLPVLYVFKPLHFETREQQLAYRRLVRDVKKTLPYAQMVAATLMETYNYMETLPNERSKARHLRQMEKDLYEQYKPELKQLTITQGKLLLKLITRECNTNSYDLIDAFLGSFSASFWNNFARVFGASLKSDYDPEGEDALTERVCIMVERGYI